MSLLSWLRHKGYPDDLYFHPCQGVTDTSSVFADPLATPHRPDADELLLPTRPGGDLCQTVDCDATAVHIVARSLRHKQVCSKCSDELCVLGGWEWVSRMVL